MAPLSLTQVPQLLPSGCLDHTQESAAMVVAVLASESIAAKAVMANNFQNLICISLLVFGSHRL